jgi:hypothetical protein
VKPVKQRIEVMASEHAVSRKASGRQAGAWVALGLALAGVLGPASGIDAGQVQVWTVQIPYDMPPKTETAPNTSVPPSNQPLSPEDLKRAEALLPMLEGKQEFWAMGEFVHLGAPAVPVLVKALTMPGPRIRFNAIETLLMIKDPSAVPALIQAAQEPNDMPRVREHALRAAVRLNPALTPPAIDAMSKDPNSSIRKVAAFEARYVRQKAVVPTLIRLISDHERFVSISAIQSLWLLTRHESEMHNWDSSTVEERRDWAKEWEDWWQSEKDTFELPEPRRPRKPLTEG